MAALLNVDKAIDDLLMGIRQNPPVTQHLTQARGYVLAENVQANVDLPPFDNSAVDGYAVIAAETQTASEQTPVELAVTLDIQAGMMASQPVKAGQAARIMTGAPLPDGADAVIMVEDTDSTWGNHPHEPAPDRVRLHRACESGQNIRRAGENVRQGQTVLAAGTVLRPAEIGMLAALGHSNVSVIRRPRVVILSSGDELVGLDDALEPGKIHDANSYTLAALVEENHGEALRLPVAPDNADAIRDLFRKALALQPDLIISSAGMSVGAADFIREILTEMGEIAFYRINLRPGKPLAYGTLGGVPFFGLPGNPVSAAVTFEVLVRPALLKLGGYPDNAVYLTARTGERMASDGRRTYARVQLVRDGDDWVAYSTGTQSSGALMSMVMADALLIIPEDTRVVEIGTPLTVKLLKPQPRITTETV